MNFNNQVNLVNEKFSDRQRFEFIDIARALLIILMVIGHSGSPITNLIYLFHMPAFIFLSGFVYKESNGNLKNNVFKKIKSLYFPYVKYQIIFLLMTNFFVFIGFYNKEQYINSVKVFIIRILDILLLGGGGGILLGPMWFIVLLFEISVTYIIINNIVSVFSKKNNISINVIVLIIFIIGFFINYLGLQIPRYIDTTLICLGVYHLGVLYKRYFTKVPMKFAYFSITFLILIYLSRIGSINIGIDMYVNPIFFIMSFVSGTYVILYIANFIENYTSLPFQFRSILVRIGRRTFSILALHLLSFKIVTLIIIILESFSYTELQSFPIIAGESHFWLLYSIVGILIPLLIIRFTTRVFRLLQ